MNFPPPFLPNRNGYMVQGLPHMLPFNVPPPVLPLAFSTPQPPLPPGLGDGLLPTPINKPGEATTHKRNSLFIYSRSELRMIENDMLSAGILSELPDSANIGDILEDGIYAPYGSETRSASGPVRKRVWNPPQRPKGAISGRNDSGDSTSSCESNQQSSSSGQVIPYDGEENMNRSYKQEAEPSSSNVYGTRHSEVNKRCNEYVEQPATSRYNPAPDVFLDRQSRFSIRNYFCRGQSWSKEARRGTFRKLFIEGCEGVQKTEVASGSRFRDRSTSQREYQRYNNDCTDNYYEEPSNKNQCYYDERDNRGNYNSSRRSTTSYEEYEFGAKLFQRYMNRNAKN